MDASKNGHGEDSEMVGCMTYDEEMTNLLGILGVSTNNFKREQRQAQRRMVAEL